MKKGVKWLVGIVVGLVLVVVLLLGGGFLLINTTSFQNKLLQKATTMLAEKLQTKVGIDSISIDLLTLDAKLYGLELEDRQQRKMLQLDYLQAGVDLWPLLRKREVNISHAKIKGVTAHLFHTPNDTIDSVANYQFVIDAFKKDKKEGKKEEEVSEEKTDDGKQKKKLKVALKKVTAEDISVTYNGLSASLGMLQLTQSDEHTIKGVVEHLATQWERTNKKGWQVSQRAEIGKLDFVQQDSIRTIDISDLHFSNDNHHPRKNAGKPKRGFFDAEHFNVTAQMKVVVDHVGKDTVHAVLQEMTACDSVMGIDLRDIHGNIAYSHQQLFFNDLVVRQSDTQLNIDSAFMQLPSKKKGIPLAYRTSTIRGRAILKDISRCFAPALSKFVIPLNLTVDMSGDDNGMTFRNVKVSTDDLKLTIGANGQISNLKDKYQLRVHFDVEKMVAHGNIKERIINQFQVKKFMMEQLAGLGTIRYKGGFNVLWKREEFQGLLTTQVGNVNFQFALDEANKYLTGKAGTKELNVGKLFKMPDIGPVAATANFKFDISKPRTALMRRQKGGKLPIGNVQAHVDQVSYKGIKAKNLEVKMVSDGAIAVGNILAAGKWLDLNCDFSFTNTSEMQKMKVNPKLKVHDVVNKEKVKAIGEKLKPKKLGEKIKGLFKKKKKEESTD